MVAWLVFVASHTALFAGEDISADFIVDTFMAVVDTDGDLMSDEWEIANGLNPAVDDSALDPDGDGFTNLEEYNAGTDPQVANLLNIAVDFFGEFIVDTSIIVIDNDSDSMADEWEGVNGLNTNLNDSAFDPDGDGYTNLEEYNAGTDPQVADDDTYSQAESDTNTVDTGGYALGYVADTDGDGMPDWWEDEYGLDPGVDDSGDDPDGDGYTNLQEYLVGLSPIVANTLGVGWGISLDFTTDTMTLVLDSDFDGMSDIWEVANGLNPFVDDAGLDPDGDGRTNIEEYNANTNPHVDDWLGPDRYASLYFTTDTGGFNGGYSDDTDGDGLPDWWELEHGGGITSMAPGDNPDGDAFTNLEEYNAGTDPNIFDLIIVYSAESDDFTVDTSGLFTDSDGDGIPDWWELQYGGDSTGMDPNADGDGDGASNYEEFVAGSNPTDGLSVFAIDNLQGTNSLVLTWATEPGRLYSVYSHTNLSTQWPTSAVYQVEGDGSVKSYTNSLPPASTRFFRLGVEL